MQSGPWEGVGSTSPGPPCRGCRLRRHHTQISKRCLREAKKVPKVAKNAVVRSTETRRKVRCSHDNHFDEQMSSNPVQRFARCNRSIRNVEIRITEKMTKCPAEPQLPLRGGPTSRTHGSDASISAQSADVDSGQDGHQTGFQNTRYRPGLTGHVVSDHHLPHFVHLAALISGLGTGSCGAIQNPGPIRQNKKGKEIGKPKLNIKLKSPNGDLRAMFLTIVSFGA